MCKNIFTPLYIDLRKFIKTLYRGEMQREVSVTFEANQVIFFVCVSDICNCFLGGAPTSMDHSFHPSICPFVYCAPHLETIHPKNQVLSPSFLLRLGS